MWNIAKVLTFCYIFSTFATIKLVICENIVRICNLLCRIEEKEDNKVPHIIYIKTAF